MLTFANAKINLGLYITEKRPDGYHNLETVFYPVKLNDVVELIDAEETSCVIKGLAVPGSADDNLCMKAFKTLQEEFDLPHQQIVLLKNIPIGAGLGGGSADAAFLIRLVNEKFNLGLAVEQMQDYARVLGADCAFFIENKPAYAFGKGDVFSDIDLDLSKFFLVLVKPPVHVSTADAYGGVVPRKPEVELKDVILKPVEQWKDLLENDFERSVFSKYPEIETIKTQLYQAGATFALMSGSGSSVFGIFKKAVALPELEASNQVFYNV